MRAVSLAGVLQVDFRLRVGFDLLSRDGPEEREWIPII